MHSIRAFYGFVAALGITLGVVACDGGEHQNAMNNPAVESRVGTLLEAIKAQDFEQATAQYDEIFFKIRAPQTWVDTLKAHLAERGPMTSYHLRRSQADTRFSGKFYILEYETVHEGSKRLHHLITLRRPVEGGGIQLIGHKITPWEATG